MDSSEDEEDDIHSEQLYPQFISKSKLHLAYKRLRNITHKKLVELEEQGLEIKTKRFTDKEDKRIKKNWRRWCRHFEHLSDPFHAFGMSVRPKKENSETDQNVAIQPRPRHVKKMFKENLFMRRMGYKLDNRLLCDIYARCKRLFVFEQFKYHAIGDLDREEKNVLQDKVIKEIFEEKETIQSISSKLNISPPCVSSIKTKPLKGEYFRWELSDDVILEESIQRQFESKDIWQVPSYKIDWKKVEKEMISCGYRLTYSQLYRRWYKRNTKMFGLRRGGRR